jgi:hypothetical protein
MILAKRYFLLLVEFSYVDEFDHVQWRHDPFEIAQLIQRVLQEWGDLKEEEQGDLIEGALYVVDSYEYRFFNSFT